MSSSTDQGAKWSRPVGNALPNPNAPFATVTIDGQVGVLGGVRGRVRAVLGVCCAALCRGVGGWPQAHPAGASIQHARRQPHTFWL